MLDYKGIEALCTVQELQSFELAAQKLRITQSAVSQRIKSLETYYGEPVLIRVLPYRLTKLGELLSRHYKQIHLLEEDLTRELAFSQAKPCISIALNRDSLETWFLDVIGENFLDLITLEVIADDQELTLNYLKNGLVSACVSTSDKPIVGGKADFLGTMEYLLVASPSFFKAHFHKVDSKEALCRATALKFDEKDKLHERYLEKFFGLLAEGLKFCVMPSVRGFKKAILSGYGYGLVPRIDICDELKTQQLVSIYPDKVWKVPLYWHSWIIQSKSYQDFNRCLIRYVTNKFKDLG